MKSLQNSSDHIRGEVSAFVATRAAARDLDSEGSDVAEFWKFLLIREDLLPFFVAADPVWNGQVLQVNRAVLLESDVDVVVPVPGHNTTQAPEYWVDKIAVLN